MPAIERWERQRRKNWLENLVKEAPSQEALGELARICAQQGEQGRAIELFGEALRRDPGDLESVYGRGLSAIETGNYQAAVEDLSALRAADPTFKLHQGSLELARAYEGLGDEERAVRVYRDILDRTPVSAAYYGLGKLLAKQGNNDEARRMLQEILAKQNGLPRYLRRQERPWVWKARVLLKKLA
jgi:tetratricopeptide (TPR) repeat protein